MRNVLLCILSIVFSLFLTVGVFAAEVKIDSAEVISSGKVKVECTLSNTAADQEITVISYEYGTDLSTISDITEDTLKKIIHIDQFAANVTNGKFEFEFDPVSWTNASKTYVVKVGGTDIAQPDTMIIKKSENDALTIIYGDADGDGVITAGDSAFILQKALVSTFRITLQDMTENWFEYTDVDGDGAITASDSAFILQKALVSTFGFSVG